MFLIIRLNLKATSKNIRTKTKKKISASETTLNFYIKGHPQSHSLRIRLHTPTEQFVKTKTTRHVLHAEK